MKYSVHPGILMAEQWEATLKEKSGRSMPEWIAFVKMEGPKTEAHQRMWLKETQGLGTNAATWIAARVNGKGEEESSPARYLAAVNGFVDAMFSGPKAALRPVYEALVDTCLALGGDVKACPGKTIVPIYRHHVIAQIKPSTRSRIDFGLALGDTKAAGRLINTGGYAKKDRITHRIEVAAIADIDDGLTRWLERAYERDAS
jgi:Domain of unknown function (DUF5655)